MSTSIKIEVPTWDGKRETFDTYVYKLRAYSAIKKIIDALDEAKMRACITQTEYDALVSGGSSTLADVAAKKLFKDNEELTGIYVLGQLSQAGINAIRKTVSDDFPLGKVVEAIKSPSLVNKPADRTAEIEMESEVQKVVFKNANEYFTEVTDILAQFNCTMSEIDLLKDLAKKTKNTTYIKMIHDEMDVTYPSFQKACLEIHKLQRMVNVLNKTEEKKVKEITLSNVGTSNQKGAKVTKCSHCQGSHSRKDCTKLKELLKKQGKCPHCNKEGHLKEECFAKYPEKKPKWMKGKFGGSGGTEASASNLEIQLALVDGQDF
jgi:hypothetical protein